MGLSQKRFQKVQENFVCENCCFKVKGSGYTDHCPNCLYSKHVDINPGDRASDCGGIMIPKAVEVKSDGYKIYYDCQKCGYQHRVKSSPDDNFEAILSLLKNPIPD
jgi:DNA replicative helicase MCM subunit Mcm2 (Cdc46/Mcm family)